MDKLTNNPMLRHQKKMTRLSAKQNFINKKQNSDDQQLDEDKSEQINENHPSTKGSGLYLYTII